MKRNVLAIVGLIGALSIVGCSSAGSEGSSTGSAGSSTGSSVSSPSDSSSAEAPTSAGSSDTASEDATTSGSGGTEAPLPATKLTLVESQQHAISMWGADVAGELGMWRDGLTVDISQSDKGVEILAAGQADMAISSPNRFIGAILNGLDATIIGPTVDVTPLYMAVSPKVNASSIKTMPKGLKVGITAYGSTSHYAMVRLAEALGWSEKDYQFVVLGGLDAIEAGMQSGAINAFLWSSVPVYTLQAQGYAKVLGSVSDILGENPGDVIVATNSAIAAHPEAIHAFCEGFYGANQRMKDNPDEASALLEKWGTDKDVVQIAIDTQIPSTSTSPEMDDAAIAGMADATRFTIEDAAHITDDQVKSMYRSCYDL